MDDFYRSVLLPVYPYPMTVFRYRLLLLALFLTGGYGALAAEEQNDAPFSPNGKVQQNIREPENTNTEAKTPSLLDKLKSSQWLRKPVIKPPAKPADSRKTEAPLWNGNGGSTVVSSVTQTPLKPQIPQKQEIKPETKPVLYSKLDPDKLTDAPLPPRNPYFDNIGQKKTELPDLPQPGGIPESIQPDMVQHDPFGTDLTEEQPYTGMSSYSFDSRDWVESFPVEYLTPAKTTQENRELKIDREPAEQFPSLAPGVSHDIFPSVPHSGQTDDWNGHAVEVVPTSLRQRIVPERLIPQVAVQNSEPKVASAVNPAVNSVTKAEGRTVNETDTPPPGFDLTPSYSKHLPYTEVCGVVAVQANFPLTEIKPILEEIRLLQQDLNLYIGVPAAKEKIELCLFRDEKTYVQFLTAVFPKAPNDRRALYIKLDKKPGTLLVQKSENFEIDLRHEMTHAIIHTSINYVPIWLDEGLAKYFEVPIQDRAMDNPYMKQTRWNTKFGAVPSLTRLEKLQDISQMGSREYRDSWSWVHYLIHYSPQTHRLLAGYLQLLAELSDSKNTGQSKTLQFPPLESYLEDTVQNPRERYREHFSGTNN